MKRSPLPGPWHTAALYPPCRTDDLKDDVLFCQALVEREGRVRSHHVAAVNGKTLGPILHDKAYIYLIRDLIKSAVDQMNEALRKTGPAMFHTVDQVRGSVDLSAFRQRFAGTDKDLAAQFDQLSTDLVNLVFREASLR